MCGLCGAMSTYLSDPEVETFRELMVMNTLRGSEGAGVVAVAQGKKDVHALKTNASGADLVMSGPFYRLMQNKRKILIGHCRLPTRGTLGIDDIHPHRVGSIYGVHNGTLWQLNGKPIPDKMSDSQALFQSFIDRGVPETIESAKGAYALIWVNEQDRTLNFLRNADRPLWFGWSGKTMTPQTMYWSSEKGMLEFILRRKYSGDVTLKEFVANTWMRYAIDNVAQGVHYQDKQELKQKHEHREWEGYGEGWAAGADGVWRPKKKEEPVTPPFRVETYVPPTTDTRGTAAPAHSTQPSVPRLKHIRETIQERRSRRLSYRLPNDVNTATVFETTPNMWVQKRALEGYLRNGCAWCGTTMDFDDYLEQKLCFANGTEFICNLCIADPAVNELLN